MIKIKKDNKSLIITIMVKQIDISNMMKLKEKIIEKLDFTFSDIILDLKKVEYIDSSGIGLIVDLYNKIRNKDRNLILKNVSADIKEILGMVNLTRFLKIE